MHRPSDSSRRAFLKTSSLSAAALLGSPMGGLPGDREPAPDRATPFSLPRAPFVLADRTLDLSPAAWIWYPAERVLQNTVVLFRKAMTLPDRPVSATGWVLGDSRYALYGGRGAAGDQPRPWRSAGAG